MSEYPGIEGKTFKLEFNEKWVGDVCWKSFSTSKQVKVLTEIIPYYVLRKIKGHKRVIKTGYKHLVELL